MLTAGIDVGSTAAKAVIFEGGILNWAVEPTGWSPREAGRKVLARAAATAGVRPDQIARVVGTGYGRMTLDCADKVVTEISCLARGASFALPDTRMVIDIGGQDSKAVLIESGGRVGNFAMNDKCAAGTGRFLQVTLNSLGLDLGALPDPGDVEPVRLNSTCTVFAESEVIGLLAREVPLDRILAGLFKAIAERTAALAGRLGAVERVTFTGGVARVPAMQRALVRALGLPVAVPEEPLIIGALGAALIASTL
ncbi:MAG: 2-hydroxyglutaryl-CoA dehydratase [Clostridia bacterium]|nr:MAG: 2-hydroxyglutaryl-CoA dehydratase [Clostridia bacterium]